MLRIAVCGDGPIAHSIAAVCAGRGHAVRLLVTHPDGWRRRIAVRLPDGRRFVAALTAIEDDPAIVCADADLIFLCVRHAEMDATLRRIAPHVRSDALVGAIPGFGAFGPLARRRLPQVACLFGTQRIPFVIRRCTPGRSVGIGGIRRQTFVGSLPNGRARAVAELLSQVLGVPTVPVSHYLNIELSPSNSLVNPARLYALFGPDAVSPPRNGLEFFTGWDIASSRSLLALDRELQHGRLRLPRDTSFVAPILLQYDANDADTLTDRFRGLRALAGRPIPLREGRLDPDSDYVREDIDHGLRLLRDVLRLAGAETPRMDAILAWRNTLPGVPPADAGPLAGFDGIEALARALD